MDKRTSDTKRGFTLTELMITISIIAILASVGWANYSQSSATSRDAKRQTDLRMLQAAIETYKKENGNYPAQCATSGGGAAGWSGQLGTDYACSDGSGEYIVDLAPAYIPRLPTDPKLNGTNSGYVYRTNDDGTVYKIKAQRTVEADTITINHALKPCDIRVAHRSDGALNTTSQDPQVVGWCGRVFNSSSQLVLPNTCRSNFDDWSKSYGLWGGLKLRTTIPPNIQVDLFTEDPLAKLGEGVTVTMANYRKVYVLQDTTPVICK